MHCFRNPNILLVFDSVLRRSHNLVVSSLQKPINMVAFNIGTGFLALTTLPSVGYAVPTLSDSDLEQVERVRARQGGKSYFASWTKSSMSVPAGVQQGGTATVRPTQVIVFQAPQLTTTTDQALERLYVRY